VNSPTVGVLLSRVRVEEKLLLEELESRHVPTKVLDDREIVLKPPAGCRIQHPVPPLLYSHTP